jgi:hypothetical protein
MTDDQIPPDLSPRANQLVGMIAGIISTIPFQPSEVHPESCLPWARMIAEVVQGADVPPVRNLKGSRVTPAAASWPQVRRRVEEKGP